MTPTSGIRRSRRLLATTLVLATAAVVGLAAAPAVAAQPAHQPQHRHAHSLGTTTLTTAPGVANTLLGAGILPLPVLPRTGFGVSFGNGLAVSYAFPIISSTADLTSATGDIVHAGGIYFVNRHASLETGRFDIDLAAGTVFATRVNFAPGRIAVLDLDLSGLSVGTDSRGDTVLTGITANLDPAAATAINSTFGTSLPTDGSLEFATAKIVING